MKTPIAIIGLGISGRASLELLLTEGFQKSDILLFDDKDTSAEIKDPAVLKSKNPQTILVSPGVPLSLPWIQELIKSGVELTSELEIAFKHLKDERVIAITGSVGKSTVTSLIGAAGKTQDENIFVGGNLGLPLAKYAVAVLQKKPRAKFVVLELSSYQLENFKNLSADVGIITYLTRNHMERYSSLKDYYDTKLSLIPKCKELVILNKSGGDLTLQKIEKGLWVDRDQINFVTQILGGHNKDNLALALKVCQHYRWNEKALEALKKFPGLSHRLENLGTVSGVHFINDSKATTMESVLQAVQATPVKGRLVVLLGGRDKNLPWEQLQVLNNKERIHAFYFGEYAEMAKKKSGIKGSVFPKLSEALKALPTFLVSGDTVLLSPGGTSLDEFKSFEDRGEFFKSWVSQFKI